MGEKLKFLYLNNNDWNSLITEFPVTMPFHTLDWLNIISEIWPKTDIHFLSIEEGKETIGLLPIMLKKKFGLKLLGSPLRGYFTPYLGPILKDPTLFDYSALIKSLIEDFYPDFLEIFIPPGLHINLEDAKKMKTVLIDLKKGEDLLWKGIKKGTRSHIRQAKKLGVEVLNPTELDSWLPIYYAMVTDTYNKQGLANPAPMSFYEQLWKVFYPKGMLKVFLARYQGKIVAGSFYLIWQGVIYGLDGASFREYRKVRPNNLIKWETIAWATKSGLAIYDMVGANVPNIVEFKKGFGGDIVEYPTFQAQPTISGYLAWKIYAYFGPKLKRVVRIKE
jgi:hypothetical protein